MGSNYTEEGGERERGSFDRREVIASLRSMKDLITLVEKSTSVCDQILSDILSIICIKMQREECSSTFYDTDLG